MITATYSPEDNKIRIYSVERLDTETYARIKAAGFSWAPKQDLFVAPMWTPERARIAMELADSGELDDEDTSLAERSEMRAERFEHYSDNRASDADQAMKAYHAIADGIPLGQPILVGHHSERHARKDAARIENNVRKAVNMWKTATYWQQRAKSAISAAKYKERPDVRARRIKKIEADMRKMQKNMKEQETTAKAYDLIDKPEKWKPNAEGIQPNREQRAEWIANRFSLYVCRESGTSWTAWQVLQPAEERYKACPDMTIDDVIRCAHEAVERYRPVAAAWIEHYECRLAYERAMLAGDGGTEADKNKPEKGGACKCWVSRDNWLEIQKVNKVSVSVLDNWGNGGPDFMRTVPFDKLSAVISRAEWEAFKAGGSHPASRTISDAPSAPAAPAVESMVNQMRAAETALRAGTIVQTVVSSTLYPTPTAIAEEMVQVAELEPGHSVLEPSAGTGALMRAIREATGGSVVRTAVEIDPKLYDRLRYIEKGSYVYNRDFLECNGDLGAFDRIIMNPPFNDGQDIQHIEHALTMLKPGGRLVALCADGPRQRERFALRSSVSGGFYRSLPPGSFSAQGTNVNVAMMLIRKE